MQKNRHIYILRYFFRPTQIVIIIGLVLGVVGGVNAGKIHGHSGIFVMDGVGKAGTGLPTL